MTDGNETILEKRLKRAELVEYDGGLVYVENYGWGEGYFDDMCDLTEYLEGEVEDEGRPGFAFLCKAVEKEMNADDMIEELCGDGYEGMEEALEIPSELVDAIGIFNEINKERLKVWQADYSRKVRVPKQDPIN